MARQLSFVEILHEYRYALPEHRNAFSMIERGKDHLKRKYDGRDISTIFGKKYDHCGNTANCRCRQGFMPTHKYEVRAAYRHSAVNFQPSRSPTPLFCIPPPPIMNKKDMTRFRKAMGKKAPRQPSPSPSQSPSPDLEDVPINPTPTGAYTE